MIKEALEYFSELTEKSLAAEKVDIGDPRKAAIVFGGELRAHDVPPAPRNHKAGTLAEIIALANRFAADTGGVSDDTDAVPPVFAPVVWYDRERVVLVIDDDGHRLETATLTLERSDVFRKVVELYAQKPWLEQKAFIRLLRIDLARTLAPVHLLDRVRRVKFENSQTVASQVARDRESLGREINSRVEAGGEIPEEVVLDVPVYKTPGETFALGIACAVEVDPTRGLFQLVPLPDEIERVTQLAVESIAERLLEGLHDGIPCYHGKP
jgi:hypothetical protein